MSQVPGHARTLKFMWSGAANLHVMPEKKSKGENSIIYSETVRVKVDVSHLKLGMYVSELDRPWDQTPFVLQGFLLKTPDHINEVRKYCDYVFIDRQKSTRVQSKPKHITPDEGAVTEKIKLTSRRNYLAGSQHKSGHRRKWDEGHHFEEKDLKPAARTYKESKKLVKSIMHDVKLGHAIDAPAVKEAVSACVDNIINQSDAMTLMSRLRNKHEYTAEHSLNVAIISITLARHAGLNHKQLHEVGLCGLLHDMGKMLTPESILNKPGPLNEEEQTVMRQHPLDGRDILASTEGIFLEATHVAHAHHERLDGNGYPQGLAEKDISVFNRIVTIADVFDAITGDRPYNNGTTVENALRFLHDGRGVNFDPILVTQFIENVGIYPLGTVVEMQNGEIGIVVNTNYEHRLRPWVKIIMDREHNPCTPIIVNLADSEVDSQGNQYWIKASHNPRNFNIDLVKHMHGQLDE